MGGSCCKVDKNHCIPSIMHKQLSNKEREALFDDYKRANSKLAQDSKLNESPEASNADPLIEAQPTSPDIRPKLKRLDTKFNRNLVFVKSEANESAGISGPANLSFDRSYSTKNVDLTKGTEGLRPLNTLILEAFHDVELPKITPKWGVPRDDCND